MAYRNMMDRKQYATHVFIVPRSSPLFLYGTQGQAVPYGTPILETIVL